MHLLLLGFRKEGLIGSVAIVVVVSIHTAATTTIVTALPGFHDAVSSAHARDRVGFTGPWSPLHPF
jgi:hypothetical protein